ncbi:MAG: hypothetical protein M3Y53_12765 [Thermoproteota archaeon]|nr:hypothetical protein [Thermoproteota archaeon]
MKNNLFLLLASGEVAGETRKVLGQYGYLDAGNKLCYKIPFHVGMDGLIRESPLTDTKMEFIEANLTDSRSCNETEKKSIFEQAKQYLESRQSSAKTFEEYSLRETQSGISW